MLPFTAEEAWLSRNPACGLGPSRAVPGDPGGMEERRARRRSGEKIRAVRTVVTGALEIERAEKRIGSSLEAAPVVHIADPELLAGARRRGLRRDLHHLGDHRRRRARARPTPSGCRRSPRSASCRKLAEGRKCARSWRITTDVGSDRTLPGGVCPRCRRPAGTWLQGLRDHLPDELHLPHSSGKTCPKFGGFFRHGALSGRAA